MRILLILLPVVASLLSPSPGARAMACLSCPQMAQGPPCQEYWRADAVFVGHVVRVDATGWPANIAPYSEYMRLTARLTVEETFRGAEGGEVTFEMNDCPYPFRQGERYLVYAHKGRNGALYLTTGSSRTRPFAEAGEDLEYIRGLARGNGKGRLFGTVSRDVPDLRPHAFRRETGVGQGKLAGVKVAAEGDSGGKYEVMTDGEGRFEFPELPVGVYKVRVPDAADSEIGGETTGLKVLAGGCVPLNVWLQPSGEISGRVATTGGEAVPEAGVILFTAEGVTDEALGGIEDRPPIMGYTNKEGRYKFVRLPAGRYYMLVTTGKRDAGRSQRRTFFPGTGSLSEATVITLEGGQKKTRLDVQLVQR